MKIGVIEWRVECGGGRHSTMMAFADCLHEVGHEVQVFSQFAGRFHETLKRYGCRSLHPDQLVAMPDLRRLYRTRAEIPSDWRGLDLLIVSTGGMGHLQRLIDVPVVAWVIHPGQARDEACTRYWTNSESTRNSLRWNTRWSDAEVGIVIPPHDYTPFRAASISTSRRKYDVAVVGASIPTKRLLEAAEAALDVTRPDRSGRPLRVAACVKTYDEHMAVEIYNQNYARQRATIEALRKRGVTVVENATRQTVAEVLGDSVFYLSLSTDESCSLVIYEALNAGCTPIVLESGSAREQIGRHGHVVKDREQAQGCLRTPPKLLENQISYGCKFDREAVRDDLVRAVERATT